MTEKAPQKSPEKKAAIKEAELFDKYMAKRKVLIADESASARSGVFGTFTKLGVKPHQIIMASSLSDAEAEIARNKPDIVIAEFNFGKYCGLDLLQRQRESNPDSKKTLFILLTSNTSQSAVARAAEEDVDAFVLKPFTPEVLRNTLIRAALLKSNPPEYLVKIEAGKAKLATGDMDGADVFFKEAMKLDERPALACYYEGKINYQKKVIDLSKGFFEEGLEYNKIHYKCMVGLYELLMEMKLHKEAYDVVKKISQYFPANPKRLAEVLKLAIINKSYEDVEKYYAVFCNIDERNDTLINYVCAALVICGKYYIRSNNKARAMELFQKCLATAAGRTKFLNEIIMALLESKLGGEAEKMLKRYPPEHQKSPEYLLLDFQVANLTMGAQYVLQKGRDLMIAGVETEKFFEIMLERSSEVKSARMMETVLSNCSTKFPKLKEKFTPIYDELVKASAQPPATPEKPT